MGGEKCYFLTVYTESCKIRWPLWGSSSGLIFYTIYAFVTPSKKIEFPNGDARHYKIKLLTPSAVVFMNYFSFVKSISIIFDYSQLIVKTKRIKKNGQINFPRIKKPFDRKPLPKSKEFLFTNERNLKILAFVDLIRSREVKSQELVITH